ncbi:hypothetical protein [Sediminicoccus sp. KRV36]|uniref:hypothetical protein n=1 Tax=Sediminicoccus sp. KRV36 TaxID=3133721 RepID=UPI00200BD4F9|nr:hypothetical protein [Sediminicoccus rosea]UPY35005.1 hypothetical protein LHU95_12250 [Sediminicoccus rosea]
MFWKEKSEDQIRETYLSAAVYFPEACRNIAYREGLADSEIADTICQSLIFGAARFFWARQKNTEKRILILTRLAEEIAKKHIFQIVDTDRIKYHNAENDLNKLIEQSTKLIVSSSIPLSESIDYDLQRIRANNIGVTIFNETTLHFLRGFVTVDRYHTRKDGCWVNFYHPVHHLCMKIMENSK